jgi:hypothetical protein
MTVAPEVGIPPAALARVRTLARIAIKRVPLPPAISEGMGNICRSQALRTVGYPETKWNATCRLNRVERHDDRSLLKACICSERLHNANRIPRLYRRSPPRHRSA